MHQYNGTAFERQLIDRALTDRDRALIRHFFIDSDNAEYTHQLFDGFEPDHESKYFRILLAGLGHSIGWTGFPPEYLERFRKIHAHFKVVNEIRFDALSQVLRSLQDAGIPVMLLKGGAVYAHYLPGVPRLMDDFDIAVPEPYFTQAAERIRSLGYRHTGSAAWAESFSTDHYGKYISLDLHKRVFKFAGNADQQVWDHAVRTVYNNVSFYVPSPEIMCIHQLDTQTRNLFYQEHPERRVKWIADWCVISRAWPDAFRPDQLKKLSERFYDTDYIRLAMRILSGQFPELMASEDVRAVFPEDNGYTDWLSTGAVFSQSYHAADQIPPMSPMTPRHIRLALKRWRDEYRFMKPELEAQYGRISFPAYFFQETGTGNIAGALKNYIPRIRIREKEDQR